MFARTHRRFFIPEIIQTSLTDCGPAALKAVLHGFGIDVNYEWLRTRCQTDVDGTSIDALAALGRELALETSEILTPRDNLLLPEADCLPAIVPTRVGGGATHFVVLWNKVGAYVQVMDPGGGRRWVHHDALLESIPLYQFPMSKARWLEWVNTADATGPLEAKMQQIGLGRDERRALLREVRAKPQWVPFARLDAAVRMVSTLVRGKTIRPGVEAKTLIDMLVVQATTDEEPCYDDIPAGFWWAQPGLSPAHLALNGIVLVHFQRPEPGAVDLDRAHRRFVPESTFRKPHGSSANFETPRAEPSTSFAPDRCTDSALPKEIDDELASAHVSPLRLLLRAVKFDTPGAMEVLLAATAFASVIAIIDVLLLRGLLDVTSYLTQRYQRALGVGAFLVFTLGALAFEFFSGDLLARVGRGLEARLRIGLLEKLPRFEDAYLRSRPTSDMASRGHAMHMIRQAPPLASGVVSAAASYVTTLLVFAWLEPSTVILTLAAAAAGLAIPYAIRKPLAESMMRLLTHTGALDRFYLDALTGAVPMRAHGAELALRREHESLLVEWARTARLVLTQTTWTRGVQSAAGTAMVIALVAGYVLSGGNPGRLLLLSFLALRLPALGEALVTQLVSSHETLNVAQRLFAPLGGKEAASARPRGDARTPEPATSHRGLAITMRDVTVRATGHVLLHGVSLDVAPGEYVSIVGASGAGKSSLIGILLGWLEPSEGEVLVDGAALDVALLRRAAVWVDPEVALWNQSLLENVTFGAEGRALGRLAEAVGGADLNEILQRLPEGLQTPLGETGSRLSGGEGQRVRIARALLREDVRLVVLDEAFRGLERERRRRLLEQVRRAWPKATMLVVSHDVSDTRGSDRVLVIDNGSIVEEGRPIELMMKATSQYRALALADADLRHVLFAGEDWRRVRMEKGRLHDGDHRGDTT